MVVDYLPAQVAVVTGVTGDTVATGSTTLRKAADVTFRTSFDERKLGAAVGTSADEVLLRPTPPLEQRFGPPGHAAPRRRDTLRRTGREEVLLHSLLVLHPLLDGDSDRVGHRHDLVRAEAYGAVGRDAAELPVDLRQRHTRAQRERNQPADRFDVGHQGAARLAERHEDFERLALVVLGDGDVHRAER